LVPGDQRRPPGPPPRSPSSRHRGGALRARREPVQPGSVSARGVQDHFTLLIIYTAPRFLVLVGFSSRRQVARRIGSPGVQPLPGTPRCCRGCVAARSGEGCTPGGSVLRLRWRRDDKPTSLLARLFPASLSRGRGCGGSAPCIGVYQLLAVAAKHVQVDANPGDELADQSLALGGQCERGPMMPVLV
jgi:hypothetical protein